MHQTLNNQVDKMAQLIDINQTSSSAVPELTWWAYKWHDHVAEMEATCGPNSMDS